MDSNMSPEDIAKKGEQIYLNTLRDILEPAHNGEYVVIEVENEQYKVNVDPVTAIQEAQAAWPGRLFHIVRVGYLEHPTVNYHRNLYARQI